MAILRRKCFISYHHTDQAAVNKFIDDFDSRRDVFIARAVGVSQDLINSQNTDYIMRRIRELYLADSTVTIVLLGNGTWARKYVDWEIASTLRNDQNNRRSGLVAITLPNASAELPPRFRDNWVDHNHGVGYAKWWKYPTSASSLADIIEDAFEGRTSRSHLIDNTRRLATRDEN